MASVAAQNSKKALKKTIIEKAFGTQTLSVWHSIVSVYLEPKNIQSITKELLICVSNMTQKSDVKDNLCKQTKRSFADNHHMQAQHYRLLFCYPILLYSYMVIF